MLILLHIKWHTCWWPRRDIKDQKRIKTCFPRPRKNRLFLVWTKAYTSPSLASFLLPLSLVFKTKPPYQVGEESPVSLVPASPVTGIVNLRLCVCARSSDSFQPHGL